MHINHWQKGGKEGSNHAPAAELVAHDCQRGVGGRRVRRENEPIRQGQDSHCRLLLSRNVVYKAHRSAFAFRSAVVALSAFGPEPLLIHWIIGFTTHDSDLMYVKLKY